MADSFMAAAEEASKVQKRQQACEARVSDGLDRLIASVTTLRDQLAAGGAPATAEQLQQLKRLEAEAERVFKDCNSATKELHSAVSKLSKALPSWVTDDKATVDLGKVLRDVEWDSTTLNTVVAEHLYRQGRFEVGDKLLEECQLKAHAASMAAPFTSMHQVLEQLRAHHAEPALQWASAQLVLLSMGMLMPGRQHHHQPPPVLPSQPSGGSAQQASDTPMAEPSAGPAAGGAVGPPPPPPPPPPPNFGLTSSVGVGTQQASAAHQQQQQQRQQQQGARATASATASVHTFQFLLHSLSFLTLLQKKGRAAALAYARQHFAPFATSGHLKNVQCLMGCLVYCKPTGGAPHARNQYQQQQQESMAVDGGSGGQAPPHHQQGAGRMSTTPPPPPQGAGHRGGDAEMTDTSGRPEQEEEEEEEVTLEGTPYAHLAGAGAWEGAVAEFSRLACSLMGMASESPLATVVAAGAVALPKLHKLVSIVSTPAVLNELKTAPQLPVELELGAEFAFHPIFACPVSRDQSTPDNPPLLLPCNHVLCEQSVYRIAKSRNRVFKCPYCPVEARADNLRPLVFPPLE